MKTDDDILRDAELAHAKLAAAVYREKGDEKILRGHNAVDPQGHLVLLAGDVDLPSDVAGWRWATPDDIAAAEHAEQKNQERDKAEAAQKAQQAARAQSQPPPRRKGGPVRK